MNDTQSKIGKLLLEGEQRDAIHIAVLPVKATRTLKPGEHVGVEKDLASPLMFPKRGIVDPYLREDVKVGQIFWLFLYPNTVQDMRHHWKLDGIDDFTAQEQAKQYLTSFAGENNTTFEELVTGLQAGEVHFGNDTSAQENAYLYREELFRNLAIFLGRHFDQDHVENTHFRCAC